MFSRRKRFGNFDKESEFFTFDSDEYRRSRQKRLSMRIKRIFTSYPWWFYYLSYILVFGLFIIGLLLYAFYAPASFDLSINERSFVKLPVKQYIYPSSLRNLSDSARRRFWEDYIRHPTDALDPDFVSLEQEGPLPVPYQGTPLWQRFRSSYQEPLDPTRKKLIIIISNLGSRKNSTELMIDTPAEVTLEFSPYADYLGQWMLFARAQGHEVLLNVPLSHAEHKSNYDPGPLGINFYFEPEQNMQSIRNIMAAATGYAGLSFFHWPVNIDENQLQPLFSEIQNRGLAVAVHPNYQNALRETPDLPSAVLDWQLFNYSIDDNYLRQLDNFVDNLPDDPQKIPVIRIDSTPFATGDLTRWIDQSEFQILPLSYLFDPVR